MSYSVEIQGKEYFAAAAIAKEVGYTPDYITKLAREQKIKATRVGRQWFVDPGSLREFVNTIRVQKAARNKALRRERRTELSGHRSQKNVPSRISIMCERVGCVQIHAPRLRALMQTGAIALSGIVLGVVMYGTDASSLTTKGQYALDVSESGARQFYEAVSEVSDSLAALSIGSFQFSIEDFFAAPLAGINRLFGMVSGDDRTESPGVVVVPANEYTDSDLDAVRASFSDEVEVAFDPHNPDTGMVTPIFRERKGEAYRFLMVPVRSP